VFQRDSARSGRYRAGRGTARFSHLNPHFWGSLSRGWSQLLRQFMVALNQRPAAVRSPSAPGPYPSLSRRRSPPRPRPYRVPELLRAIEVLNLLELTGSQRATSQALGLHQSSVSRSLRSLRLQLSLTPGPSSCLRYGDGPGLGHLRQALRAHRIADGWLQLAADPLHQGLLNPAPGLLPGPAAWLTGERLAELVHHAVLDGGLVSSLAWGSSDDPSRLPLLAGAGLTWFPLGELPLWLVAAAPTAGAVLVPPAGAAPALHAELGQRGLALQVLGASGLVPRSWLRRARSQGLALPLCPALLPTGWLDRKGWQVLPDQPPLRQRLWLLLSSDLPPALQEGCRRRLQRRCAALAAGGSGCNPKPCTLPSR
jgi:hypothetical protein